MFGKKLKNSLLREAKLEREVEKLKDDLRISNKANRVPEDHTWKLIYPGLEPMYYRGMPQNGWGEMLTGKELIQKCYNLRQDVIKTVAKLAELEERNRELEAIISDNAQQLSVKMLEHGTSNSLIDEATREYILATFKAVKPKEADNA